MIFDPKNSWSRLRLGWISRKPVKIVKKWLNYLVLEMFLDILKKFCDHSMILWEMAGDLPTNGLNQPPCLLRLKSQVLLNLIVQNTNLFGLFYLVGIERVSGLAVQTWSRSPRCRPFFPRVGKYWWTSLEWPRPQFFRPRLAFLWHRGLTSGRGRKRTSCHLRPAKKNVKMQRHHFKTDCYF